MLGTYQAQFELSLTWFDPRLKFYNLKDDSQNILSREEQNEIWLPVVVFDNTPKKITTLNDLKTFISVNKTGSFKRSETDSVDNIYIYQGSQNALTASRMYNNEFLCEYYLAYYPFDDQNCTMIFRMEGDFGTLVDLTQGKILTSLKAYYQFKVYFQILQVNSFMRDQLT